MYRPTGQTAHVPLPPSAYPIEQPEQSLAVVEPAAEVPPFTHTVHSADPSLSLYHPVGHPVHALLLLSTQVPVGHGVSVFSEISCLSSRRPFLLHAVLMAPALAPASENSFPSQV